MKKQKIAFVLGGGSIKVAYQIGQMHTLIHSGVVPDIITGISGGSLNGFLYAHYLGLYKDPKLAIDSCVAFWINNIKKPSDIIKQKSIVRIVYEIASGKFTGLLKTEKLEKLINDRVDVNMVRAASVDLDVGAVNMNTGMIVYFNKVYSLIRDCVIASTRIPIMMPPTVIAGEEYYDGGLIDNAPLGQAIKKDADILYVLATSPERIKIGFKKSASLLGLVNRVMEITVNNTLNDDIKNVLRYNRLIKNGYTEKKLIETHIYRPEETIEVDIENFNEMDIVLMIELGKKSI